MNKSKNLQALRSKEADVFTASLPPVISEDIWGEQTKERDEMKLREALEVAKSSVTPGALSGDGHSYVYMVEDDEDRPFRYYPDIESPVLDCWNLQEDQIDSLVLFASQDCWIPVSNFVF